MSRRRRGPAPLDASLPGFFNCSTEACAPQYFCVRLSHNGRHLHQLCDPNEDVDLYSAGPSGPASRTTGVVRRAILDFWRQLRRSQYIDRASRAVAISFQIDANLAAVSSFTTVLFELTAAGSVLVSTDMAVTPNQIDDTVAYGRGALTTFCVYQLFELAELYRFGFFGYLGSLYNLIDAASILVFVSISIRCAAPPSPGTPTIHIRPRLWLAPMPICGLPPRLPS